ncbi:hypothetical protein SHVI106290_01085 [Shewanella violacea]
MNLAEFAIKQRLFVLFFSVVVTLYPGASAKQNEQQ